MPAGSPFVFTLAPAVAGLVSLFLGSFTAARLTESKVTFDEAALRLFAAFFIFFGLWFLSDAIRGLRVAPGGRRQPAGLGWTALAALVVGALAAPFNVLWTAPWTLFQSLVFALDVIFAVLVVRTIGQLWRRRRGTRSTPPAALSATRLRIRQRRFTFIALLLGSLGVLVGWTGVRQATADWNAWSRLQRVDGLVTLQRSFSFRGRDGRPAPNAAAVIRYEVDGKSHQTIQRIDPSEVSNYLRGARAALVYDPASPERARVANAYETFLIPGALLMTSVILLGLGGMSASRAAAASRG